jgi:hypothetical protein
MSADEKLYPKYLDWLRYFSATMLYAYGISKLAGGQFTLHSEVAQRPIGSLDGLTLTWFYYGYSPIYRWILGLTQLAGASLLLFRKSALLGAAILTPVMANILLINIFYSIAVGAEAMATIILASMLLLLWQEHNALLNIFWAGQTPEPAAAGKRHWLIRTLILLSILIWIAIFTWPHR